MGEVTPLFPDLGAAEATQSDPPGLDRPAAATCPATTLVVPCYNEAERLQPERFLSFLDAHPEVRLLFVDDGSTDRTATVLAGLEAHRRVEVLTLPRNRGQGEAVRTGLLHAFARGDAYAGFWDADLAAPLEEVPRLVRALEEDARCEAVFGSRIRLLGAAIQRRPYRHYVGRLCATTARTALRLDVYDTQCGAKVFRRTPHVEQALATPFRSRWLFDLEILARLTKLKGSRRAVEEAVCELPLRSWRDVEGSKLRLADFLRAPFEIARIHRDLR